MGSGEWGIGIELTPTPYSLLPTPHSLLPTPYSLLPTPHSLLPTPHSLLPTPYSPFPTPHQVITVGLSIPVKVRIWAISFAIAIRSAKASWGSRFCFAKFDS